MISESGGRELIPLALAISPQGGLHLDVKPSRESTAPAALARELSSDLALGPGFAILQLAARHPGETLPPSMAFCRDLGALFLARACAAPEEASHDAPADELSRLLSQAPPIAGGEYLRPATPETLWTDLNTALSTELRGTSLEQWFKDGHAAWNVVGRVCFHLAENKADDDHAFAFLAAYTTRLSSRAQPQHRPLGHSRFTNRPTVRVPSWSILMTSPGLPGAGRKCGNGSLSRWEALAECRRRARAHVTECRFPRIVRGAHLHSTIR